MRVVKLLGGTFPDKLVIPKLPSAENSVNFKPAVVPSDSIVNKDLPVLFFHTGSHENYHRPSDDVELINYEGIHEISNYIVNVIAEIIPN